MRIAPTPITIIPTFTSSPRFAMVSQIIAQIHCYFRSAAGLPRILTAA
jgi:hypothetical protein